MNKIDLAYAAGIIDGEGCIFIGKKKNKRLNKCYYWLQINVETADDIIAPWFSRNFGGSNYIKTRMIAITFQERKETLGRNWSRVKGHHRADEIYKKERELYLQLRESKNNHKIYYET